MRTTYFLVSKICQNEQAIRRLTKAIRLCAGGLILNAATQYATAKQVESLEKDVRSLKQLKGE